MIFNGVVTRDNNANETSGSPHRLHRPDRLLRLRHRLLDDADGRRTDRLGWVGNPPTANDEPGEQKRPAKRRTARNREIILGPLNDAPPQSDAKARYDDWTRQPNEDLEADARLARQTKICKGC